MREIGRFNPPQTIKFTCVHEHHLLMLQTRTKTKKKHVQENSSIYILPQKKGKKMMVLRAETDRKECWKKKKGGCEAPQGSDSTVFKVAPVDGTSLVMCSYS